MFVWDFVIGYFYSLSVTRIGLIQLEPFQRLLDSLSPALFYYEGTASVFVFPVSVFIYFEFCIPQQRGGQKVMFGNETITILKKFDPCIKILI